MADKKDYAIVSETYGHTGNYETIDEAVTAGSRHASEKKTTVRIYEAVRIIRTPVPAVEVVTL